MLVYLINTAPEGGGGTDTKLPTYFILFFNYTFYFFRFDKTIFSILCKNLPKIFALKVCVSLTSCSQVIYHTRSCSKDFQWDDWMCAFPFLFLKLLVRSKILNCIPYYMFRCLLCDTFAVRFLQIAQHRCRTAMLLHTNYNSKIQIAQQRCHTQWCRTAMM